MMIIITIMTAHLRGPWPVHTYPPDLRTIGNEEYHLHIKWWWRECDKGEDSDNDQDDYDHDKV